jgi:hypothetical protein
MHTVLFRSFFRGFFQTTLFSLLCILAPAVFADSASDMAAMQQKLNQETLDKPFAVEDAEKIDSYINDAMKRDLKPKQTAPNGWLAGNTCDSYYAGRYNYYAYRDCQYYHRYYGRYW